MFQSFSIIFNHSIIIAEMVQPSNLWQFYTIKPGHHLISPRLTLPPRFPHGFPMPPPSAGSAGTPRAPCAAPRRPAPRRHRGRTPRWEWRAAAGGAGPGIRRCPQSKPSVRLLSKWNRWRFHDELRVITTDLGLSIVVGVPQKLWMVLGKSIFLVDD